MDKGVNVKLSVGDISKTGKKVISWNANEERHKKYTLQCIKCNFICQTSIKSFYNSCKSCSTVRKNTTTKERQLWNRYKSKAILSNMIFEITEEQFAEIIKQNCFYCDKEPSQKIIMGRKNDNVLIYNGVDRKYDELGYTVENCVACCWICNQAKKNYGIDNFKKMVIRWNEMLDKW